MNQANILLVDDDDQIATIIQKALATFGYTVVRARNGREALAAYDRHSVQLVLTDLIMPDGEGMELIMALRKAHPTVKIIAMSGGGHGDPEANLKVARIIGAMKTLAKPFSVDELQRVVKECLAAA